MVHLNPAEPPTSSAAQTLQLCPEKRGFDYCGENYYWNKTECKCFPHLNLQLCSSEKSNDRAWSRILQAENWPVKFALMSFPCGVHCWESQSTISVVKTQKTSALCVAAQVWVPAMTESVVQCPNNKAIHLNHPLLIDISAVEPEDCDNNNATNTQACLIILHHLINSQLIIHLWAEQQTSSPNKYQPNLPHCVSDLLLCVWTWSSGSVSLQKAFSMSRMRGWVMFKFFKRGN